MLCGKGVYLECDGVGEDEAEVGWVILGAVDKSKAVTRLKEPAEASSPARSIPRVLWVIHTSHDHVVGWLVHGGDLGTGEGEGIRGISSRDIDKGPDDNAFGRRREFDRKVLDFSNSSDSGRVNDSGPSIL